MRKKQQEEQPEQDFEPIEVSVKTPVTAEQMEKILSGDDEFDEPYTEKAMTTTVRRDPITAKHAMDLLVDTPDNKMSRITSTPRRSFFTLVANETMDRVASGEADFISGRSIGSILRDARDARALSIEDDKGQGFLSWALLQLGLTVTEETEGRPGHFV